MLLFYRDFIIVLIGFTLGTRDWKWIIRKHGKHMSMHREIPNKSGYKKDFV